MVLLAQTEVKAEANATQRYASYLQSCLSQTYLCCSLEGRILLIRNVVFNLNRISDYWPLECQW